MYRKGVGDVLKDTDSGKRFECKPYTAYSTPQHDRIKQQ